MFLAAYEEKKSSHKKLKSVHKNRQKQRHNKYREKKDKQEKKEKYRYITIKPLTYPPTQSYSHPNRYLFFFFFFRILAKKGPISINTF